MLVTIVYYIKKKVCDVEEIEGKSMPRFTSKLQKA